MVSAINGKGCRELCGQVYEFLSGSETRKARRAG
jgi:hypothetical protein